MGVYIPKMKKPQYCGTCILCLDDSRICHGYCMIFHRKVNTMELDKDCPLVAIPEHGDLIDRDAFVKELEYSIELEQRALDDMECVGKDRELLLLDRICRQNSIHYLSEASIIIPASEEGE